MFDTEGSAMGLLGVGILLMILAIISIIYYAGFTFVGALD